MSSSGKRVGEAGDVALYRLGNNLSLEEACFKVFTRTPRDVKRVGEGNNSCWAFRLTIGDRKIKCYECDSPRRARMIQRATSALERQNVPIPCVYAAIDHVIFAQWIEGNELTSEGKGDVIARMATYQSRIHSVKLTDLGRSDARFVHLEWLLERLRTAGEEFVPRKSLESLSQAIRNTIPRDLKIGVVHPDFTKFNIIIDSSGELVAVDNELMGIGYGFEFDVLNSSRVLSWDDDGVGEQYLEAYGRVGSYGSLIEQQEFWDLCFLTKLTAKALVGGDVELGKERLALLESKVRRYPLKA